MISNQEIIDTLKNRCLNGNGSSLELVGYVELLEKRWIEFWDTEQRELARLRNENDSLRSRNWVLEKRPNNAEARKKIAELERKNFNLENRCKYLEEQLTNFRIECERLERLVGDVPAPIKLRDHVQMVPAFTTFSENTQYIAREVRMLNASFLEDRWGKRERGNNGTDVS